MTEEETAHVLALEHAFAVLAQALSEKGVLPKDDLREKLRSAGSNLVMTSALPLAKKSGHELARIADRLL